MARSAGAAALGVALLASGAAFDSPSLYVPGLVLAALASVAAVWVLLAARGAVLVRELGPPLVEEDRPYPLVLRFRAGLLRPPGGEVIDPLLAGPLPVGGRRARTEHLEVRFGRRGRRALAPARLVLRDPLWLALRERSAGAAAEIVVLPRVEPVIVSDRHGPGGRPGELARPLASSASELELDHLRPYREGAPASRIHWPTVARTGELIERRLVGDEDVRPLVVLDARRPASAEALDRAVRAAASLTVTLARDGGCSLLLPGDRRPADVAPELRTWPALHVRLALVEEVAEPPAASRLQHAGTLFWVTAAEWERLPAGLERASASVRYLVTPGPDGGAAAFTVAGCSGRRLRRRSGRAAA